ncbi:TetR/AcrR family transcriptional regulator [Sphingomonas carotinifaciens]|uniref:TetR/AcrR family transcriptional regulator n=1 Tax=Sphingomonas carotinifaciens TaxID=1166323 RepID=UPI0039A15A23
MPTDKRTTGRPTREQAQQINDLVLTGAREAFCCRGIDGTSMEEIAAAVGVSKHTIYRRYPGKMALLDAVVTRDLERLAEAFVEGDGAENPLASLKRASRHFFGFCLSPDNVRFMAFLTSEAAYSEELRTRFAAWNRIMSAPMLDRIRHAQAAGLLRQADPTCLYHLLGDLLDGPTRRLQFGLPDPFCGLSPDAFFEERWRVFLRDAAM